MPRHRTTRDYMKSKIDQSDAAIAKALELLAEVWTTYKDAHPEIAEGISIVMEGLDTAKEFLQDIDKTI